MSFDPTALSSSSEKMRSSVFALAAFAAIETDPQSARDAAIAQAQAYSWDATALRYEALYREVLGRWPGDGTASGAVAPARLSAANPAQTSVAPTHSHKSAAVLIE